MTITDPIAAKKLRMSIIYQELWLAPNFTVAENMFLGNERNAGFPNGQAVSQDPMEMGKLGVKVGVEIMNGKKPENPVTLMESKLVTRDNVAQYPGWSH